MKVIGLAGESGSGKTTLASIMDGILSGMGHRTTLDAFFAPVKWVCRVLGWDGRPSPRWRSEMQRLGVEARQTRNWFSGYVDRFPASARIADFDMVRLERNALDWDFDKFVFWLAIRNGLTPEFSSRKWFEYHLDSGHVRPDFLLVPDVRYPAEAEFCREFGVLLYLDGTHQPLEPDQRAHETESHLPALRERADFIVPYQHDYQSASVYAEQIIFDILGHLERREKTA